MRAILDVILFALSIYVYIVFAMAIFSWLLAFNIVNFHNQVVRGIWNFLCAVTEPVLRPIRSFLPNLGGIDISPVILLLGIMLLQNIIVRYIYPNVF
ncbi:YggT family protein [Microvirga sp. W0021]|uniref:YggT family protein n=1 Tax=Hohaiivirga grylli TaxID=3133970 RepID=A0ABV0BLR0_9HYPH